MHIKHLQLFLLFIFLLISCKDEVQLQDDGFTTTPEQSEKINKLTGDYSDNIEAYRLAVDGEEIIDFVKEEDGNYIFQLKNGSTLNSVNNNSENNDIPLFGINESGYWIYTLGGQTQNLKDMSGNDAAALSSTGQPVVAPRVSLSSEGKWLVSFNGNQWKKLSDDVYKEIDKKAAADFALFSSSVIDETAETVSLKPRCGVAELNFELTSSNTTPAWRKFVMKSEDNLLLDFSYAGYKHGEMTPPDGFALGYKVINIAQEMTVRGKSARETFIEVLRENRMTANDKGNQSNPNARVVLYFPKGDYVLHNEDDNRNNPNSENKKLSGHKGIKPYDPTDIVKVDNTPVAYGLDSKENNTSDCIIITAGNFVIKGDGRGQTRIIMSTPMLPTNPATLYSSPDLLQIKHNSNTKDIGCSVLSDAPKGSFSVQVSAPDKIKIGDWVCLYLLNNNDELIAKELYPHQREEYMGNMAQGVRVNDYHQVIGKNGNTIVFKEPIMHEVEAKWGWKIYSYPHYENVGVEDLTFVGNCVDDFKHHRSWIDDGAYKPISFTRLTNSWLRRVDFKNVSEAMSITTSANCSAYDVNITGYRGHSAIRSAGSSRIFIGAVTDRTAGPAVGDANKKIDDAGQYHACGVSKPSMGAVIWNVHWGTDGCFEAHATQPRATLIDNCHGGFMQSRQGGDSDQVPNHLADLTIWNMNVEQVGPLSNKGDAPADGKFDWWRYGSESSQRVANNWKILPPVVVGIHGMKVDFVQDEKQIKLDESNGTKVQPESLYEAQLKLRLGYVPAWLLELKGK